MNIEPQLPGAPGMAGGPGPTPPGVDDGTAVPREPAPDEPGAAGKQREAGEASERSAGNRGDEISEDSRRDPGRDERQPEEQQPDEG